MPLMAGCSINLRRDIVWGEIVLDIVGPMFTTKSLNLQLMIDSFVVKVLSFNLNLL